MRVGILALMLSAAAVVGSGPGVRTLADETVTLSLVVERREGPPVLLQFLMRADSPREAELAARVAVRALLPEGRVVDVNPDAASAQYAFWSWKWDEAELPVTVAYNPTGAPPGFGPPAVVAALKAWTGIEGSMFAFRYGGVTERRASLQDGVPDGENVIEWRDLPCTQVACALGLTSKELTHEADLVLNSNPAAQLGDGLAGALVDAGTVALHETGHIAGLEHSCPPLIGPCTTEEVNAVMYFQYAGVHRLLGTDDRAGIIARYPAGATPPDGRRVVTFTGGWNLAVLPAGGLDDLMVSLACAHAVYRWRDDGWVAWVRGLAPRLQTLSSAVEGTSYWVWADDECSGAFP